MKNDSLHILMSTLLCILTLAVFLAFYYRLPPSVPVHFDLNGNPNSYWPRDLVVFGGPAAYSIINLLVAFRLKEHEKKRFRIILHRCWHSWSPA